MKQFNQKTVVISGGAEGIGYSIATALGHAGANLVIADIDSDTLEQAKSSLTESGFNVLTVQMDVTQPEQWEQVADAAEAEFGRIDMLVNNAGVASKPGTVEQTDMDDWRWVIDVNLLGVVQGAATIVPRIKKHGEGRDDPFPPLVSLFLKRP